MKTWIRVLSLHGKFIRGIALPSVGFILFHISHEGQPPMRQTINHDGQPAQAEA
jgi:hypothetical protein